MSALQTLTPSPLSFLRNSFSSCVMAAMSFNLPLGFRFSPTEEELIDYYLRSKITGINNETIDFIHEVQFFKQEPRDLPGLSVLKTRDKEWFFFSPEDLKNPNGNRLNRKTNDGYWKVTGKDQEIRSEESLIGKKKILVFYQGSTGNSKKTDWVMHEYHATTLKEVDGTKPGQQNSCKAGPAKSKLAPEDHRTTNESLHSENSDGIMAYDTSESPDNGSNIGRKRKYSSSKAGPANTSKRSAASAPEKQAEDHTTTNECLHSQNSNTIEPVGCSDISYNTSAAGNQLAEMAEMTDTELDLLLEEYIKMLPDLMQNPLEAESELTESSVSPASGEEGANHVTRCNPTKTLDGTTSNTISFTECNPISDNAYNTTNQAAQVITDELVDSNMSRVSQELLEYYSTLGSPLPSQMQYELGPLCVDCFYN